jgi:hypothetical protein
VPLTVEEQAAAEVRTTTATHLMCVTLTWLCSNQAIIRSRPNVSIADKFNIPLTGKDVVCLRDGAWLTDEVMNFYTEMVLERNKALTVAANRDASGARTAISEFRQFVHNRVPRVHMFNT